MFHKVSIDEVEWKWCLMLKVPTLARWPARLVAATATCYPPNQPALPPPTGQLVIEKMLTYGTILY